MDPRMAMKSKSGKKRLSYANSSGLEICGTLECFYKERVIGVG
jgi:hypothetical protein